MSPLSTDFETLQMQSASTEVKSSVLDSVEMFDSKTFLQRSVHKYNDVLITDEHFTSFICAVYKWKWKFLVETEQKVSRGYSLGLSAICNVNSIETNTLLSYLQHELINHITSAEKVFKETF